MHHNNDACNAIARNAFRPVYDVLAQQILDSTGVLKGICLDLNSYGGHLGLALAQQSKLRVCLLDRSPDLNRIAEANIIRQQLDNRVVAVCGDAECIPLKTGNVDLVVSHKSTRSWVDQPEILREIWRVLTPGGYIYLGSGFGSSDLKQDVIKKIQRSVPDWEPEAILIDARQFQQTLRKAKIPNATCRNDESGSWFIVQKQQ